MELSLKEKMLIVTGRGNWHTKGFKNKLPEIHLSDGPHGLRKQFDKSHGNNDSVIATCFPTACAVASSFDPNLAKMMGQGIAREAWNEDVSILLGPGVNMKRSPLCGRNFEYYSEDPYLAGEMGASFVGAVEAEGIGTSLKHFACNSQEKRRQTSNSMVDERALREIYLRSFEKVVKKAQPATIMASYNLINGEYAVNNKHLLTDILRNEWGFKGVVVSDWGACYDLPKALQSGMDLEMPDSHGIHYKFLKKALKEGRITEEELSVPANRVLQMVEKYKVNKRLKKDCADNHEKAVLIESESAVLLKNDGILPLKDKKVYIVGAMAENVRIQGGGSSHINTDKSLSAIEAFEKAGYDVIYLKGYDDKTNSEDESLLEELFSNIKENRPILFFGGLTDISEGEGYDRKTTKMPYNQYSLIEKLSRLDKKIIFISMSGSPYKMDFYDQVDAILHMYLGGEGTAEAVERLVSGKVNPSGKLPETWPRRADDTPCYEWFARETNNVSYRESIFIGYRYYDTFNIPVRFKFGYGLSYTTFSYSDLSFKDNKVSFKVKNTGNVAGKEISMVFIKNPVTKYLREKRSLKGFTKTYLEPGQEVLVTVELDDRAFQIFDTESNSWITPKENYTIEVGGGLDNLVLSKDITYGDVVYTKDDTKLLPSYFKDNLFDIPDSEFEALLGRKMEDFDDFVKGNYKVCNSLEILQHGSPFAKWLLRIGKKFIYRYFKGKDKDDPEVMMIISGATEGMLDSIIIASGIPYRVAEAIVLKANGKGFKAFLKILFG